MKNEWVDFKLKIQKSVEISKWKQRAIITSQILKKAYQFIYKLDVKIKMK